MRLKEQMRVLKRAVVLQAIAEADTNLGAAARNLGIHRNTIGFICDDLGIDIAQLRANRHAMRALIRYRKAE